MDDFSSFHFTFDVPGCEFSRADSETNSCCRLVPVFPSARFKWVRTVFTETNRSFAVSFTVDPWPINAATCASALVNPKIFLGLQSDERTRKIILFSRLYAPAKIHP